MEMRSKDFGVGKLVNDSERYIEVWACNSENEEKIKDLQENFFLIKDFDEDILCLSKVDLFILNEWLLLFSSFR